MIKTSSFVFLFFFSITSIAKTPDLTKMTEQEKQLTGLNKLSSDELNALSDWLNNKQIIIDRETRKRNAGFEARRQESNKQNIETVLLKQYTDKIGRTFYELDNGQIWRNTSSNTLYLKKNGDQKVTIKPGILNSWIMRGDGNNSGVKVKRIK